MGSVGFVDVVVLQFTHRACLGRFLPSHNYLPPAGRVSGPQSHRQTDGQTDRQESIGTISNRAV